MLQKSVTIVLATDSLRNLSVFRCFWTVLLIFRALALHIFGLLSYVSLDCCRSRCNTLHIRGETQDLGTCVSKYSIMSHPQPGNPVSGGRLMWIPDDGTHAIPVQTAASVPQVQTNQSQRGRGCQRGFARGQFCRGRGGRNRSPAGGHRGGQHHKAASRDPSPREHKREKTPPRASQTPVDEEMAEESPSSDPFKEPERTAVKRSRGPVTPPPRVIVSKDVETTTKDFVRSQNKVVIYFAFLNVFLC